MQHVEAGIVTFEEEFLAHMVLPNAAAFTPRSCPLSKTLTAAES